MREDEYAEGAAVKFGTYLFHADSDETDLKQLIGKKINAKGLIVTQRTEIGKDPDHLDQTYEIELQISDVEVLGDAAESMSYIVVDNEFDNNFLVGQLYQFDIAWLESQNDAFDVLNYNTDGSILCQYKPREEAGFIRCILSITRKCCVNIRENSCFAWVFAEEQKKKNILILLL